MPFARPFSVAPYFVAFDVVPSHHHFASDFLHTVLDQVYDRDSWKIEAHFLDNARRHVATRGLRVLLCSDLRIAASVRQRPRHKRQLDVALRSALPFGRRLRPDQRQRGVR